MMIARETSSGHLNAIENCDSLNLLRPQPSSPEKNFAPSENLNGILSQGPRLRGTSYSGSPCRQTSPNRNAVAAYPFPPVRLTPATIHLDSPTPSCSRLRPK